MKTEDEGRKKSRLLLNTSLYWFYTPSEIHDIENDPAINDKLNDVITDVDFFTEINSCIDYLTDEKDRKIFLVISSSIDEDIIPQLQRISQLIAIYIYGSRDAMFAGRMAAFGKVRGVYTIVDAICEDLQNALRSANQDAISMSFVQSHDENNTIDLDHVDPSFMYARFFKTIILKTHYNDSSRADLISLWRETHGDNKAALSFFEDFKKNYAAIDAIRWYSQSIYLYSVLNQALRTLDARVIVAMGFFIQDLHRAIEGLQMQQNIRSQPLTVYRGQKLTFSDFQRLKQSIGSILSFNCFLSTTLDRNVAIQFTSGSGNRDGCVSIVFQIEIINDNTQDVKLANITRFSKHPEESEVLLSMPTFYEVNSLEQDPHDKEIFNILLKTSTRKLDSFESMIHRLAEEYQLGEKALGMPGLLHRLGYHHEAERMYKDMILETDSAQISPKSE